MQTLKRLKQIAAEYDPENPCPIDAKYMHKYLCEFIEKETQRMANSVDAIATHINRVQANRMLRNNAMTATELRQFIVQYRNNLSPELVERIARNVEFETGIKCE